MSAARDVSDIEDFLDEELGRHSIVAKQAYEATRAVARARTGRAPAAWEKARDDVKLAFLHVVQKIAIGEVTTAEDVAVAFFEEGQRPRWVDEPLLLSTTLTLLGMT